MANTEKVRERRTREALRELKDYALNRAALANMESIVEELELEIMEDRDAARKIKRSGQLSRSIMTLRGKLTRIDRALNAQEHKHRYVLEHMYVYPTPIDRLMDVLLSRRPPSTGCARRP